MSSADFVGLIRIAENAHDDIIKVCRTLVRILGGIVTRPNDTEPRRIRLDHADIVENLMPYSGALEILFEIGFQEVSAFFKFTHLL